MAARTDKKKLSKRHGATAVGDYQQQGILPPAMRNFLALLGWSPGEDREILSEDELVSLFSLDGIQKKPAVFDTTKLEWMNGQYLSLLPVETLVEPVLRELDRMEIQSDTFRQRLRQGFLTEAARRPDKILVVDADRPVHVIQAEIRAAAEKFNV